MKFKKGKYYEEKRGEKERVVMWWVSGGILLISAADPVERAERLEDTGVAAISPVRLFNFFFLLFFKTYYLYLRSSWLVVLLLDPG